MAGNPFHAELEQQFRSRHVRVQKGDHTYEGWLRMWHYNQPALILADAIRDGDDELAEVMIAKPDAVERVTPETTIERVDPADLSPSPYTQRSFDNHDFREFTRTLRERDHVKQFPLVRPVGNAAGPDSGEYEIVSGHKRARAATEAGLKTIAVEVSDLSDWTALEIFVDEHFPVEDREFDEADRPESGWYAEEDIEAALEALQEDWSESELREHPTLNWYLDTEPLPDDEADEEQSEADAADVS
jgi:hypothetical protein